MIIGSKIKKIREQKQYTQEYLAESIGISQPAYVQLEKGQTKIGIDRLILISKILEIDIQELLKDDNLNLNVQNNKFHDNSSVIHNFYNTQKDQYENQIVHLRDEIAFLRDLLKK